ncbi:MAG: BrnT family toxin [Ardenticatenaceae bacterium]|nr:BrnT family toxin [Ardenticatenaceae bacterium]MCB8988299.1 BrnT family toxin [Ardenticatenaceae bacterium]
MVRFDWDRQKARSNLAKHGVSFDEAKTVFEDPFAITIPDPDHSDKEMRFIDLGYSRNSRLLIVVYTERNDTIRIISSREADKNERKQYET